MFVFVWLILPLIGPRVTAVDLQAAVGESTGLGSARARATSLQELIGETARVDRSGVETVYLNETGEVVLELEPNVRVADDIRTTCSLAELVLLELAVTGQGDGSGPGFTIVVELFDACPSGGGVPIDGTRFETQLPNDGWFVVSRDFSDQPLAISGEFWVAVHSTDARAGWRFGGAPRIGASEEVFDDQFPCTTTYGGCPPDGPACANGDLRVDVANCVHEFRAYRAEDSSGFSAQLNPGQRIADDVRPITAPHGLCALTNWRPAVNGSSGTYGMSFEVWSDDETLHRPASPVMGAARVLNGLPPFQVQRPNLLFDPPVAIPTAEFWLVYQPIGNDAGPVLVEDYPDIGFSANCYALFGNPTPGEWSGCDWIVGECTDGQTCDTFQNSLWCAGFEPAGACCDVTDDDPADCLDDVPVTQCGGRAVGLRTCSEAEFDPPCGTAACCKLDESCENVRESACAAQAGFWQPGLFCGDSRAECPPAVCLTSSNPCNAVNYDAAGCGDSACCRTVCEFDAFCCGVAWDTFCVDLALTHCPFYLYDECVDAIEVSCDGSATLSNSLATRSPFDPPIGCFEGEPSQYVGTVWAKFTASGPTARLSTCNSPGQAVDSILAVYSGSCLVLHEIACSDNVESCGIGGGRSQVCLAGLTPGDTYYVQLASASDAARGPYLLELECPAPMSCGAPANDDCVNATSIALGLVEIGTSGATTDGPALPISCHEGAGLAFGADVWFAFTSPDSGGKFVSFCGETTFNSRIAVYDECDCPAISADTIACDDDGCGQLGGGSALEFQSTAGRCYLIRVGGFGPLEQGSGVLALGYVDALNCPPGRVEFLNPVSGTVDARQPHPIDDPTQLQGISMFGVVAPKGAADSCWRLCETESAGFPNAIIDVIDDGDGLYDIVLARPITPGAVTRLAYHPDDGVPIVGTFISHPANVNGDSTAAPTDILRLIDCLNPVGPSCPAWGLYGRDIDHSGVFTPADVLRLIDLLNGANAFEPWNGTVLPEGECEP